MTRLATTTVTVICDRCGAKTEGDFRGGSTRLHIESTLRYRYKYSGGGALVVDSDLCSACGEQFDTFMKSGAGRCST